MIKKIIMLSLSCLALATYIDSTNINSLYAQVSQQNDGTITIRAIGVGNNINKCVNDAEKRQLSSCYLEVCLILIKMHL